MKKDIDFYKADGVVIFAIKEWDPDFTSQQWYVYLINNRKDLIEAVLVMSRGHSEEKKTSTLRHGLGDMEAGQRVKIELISEEVFGFRNEYLVTYFVEGKMYEQTFVFKPYRISEKNRVLVEGVEEEAVPALPLN